MFTRNAMNIYIIKNLKKNYRTSFSGLFPLSQHFEKSNSHIANILIFTHEWSADYSLFSQVTECVMNYLSMQNFKKYILKVNKQKVF